MTLVSLYLLFHQPAATVQIAHCPGHRTVRMSLRFLVQLHIVETDGFASAFTSLGTQYEHA